VGSWELSSVLRSSRQILDLVRKLRLRRKMKYAVYKRTYGDHGRWYTRPLKGGDSKDYIYVFKGMDATIRACQKAQELNQAEGRSALAA
jgi:hypothetical protein